MKRDAANPQQPGWDQHYSEAVSPAPWVAAQISQQDPDREAVYEGGYQNGDQQKHAPEPVHVLTLSANLRPIPLSEHIRSALFLAVPADAILHCLRHPSYHSTFAVYPLLYRS